MCEYCTHNPQKQIPVIDADISYGVLGKSRVAMMVHHQEKGAFLSLFMDNYGLGGQTVSRMKKLNFCPICGAGFDNGKEARS